MSGTEVMMLGALPAGYPGSGGPMPAPATAPYGSGPEWRTNHLTTSVTTPQQPQNLQRVWNGGAGWAWGGDVGANAGSPILNTISGLLTPTMVVPPKNLRGRPVGGNPMISAQSMFTMGLGAHEPGHDAPLTGPEEVLPGVTAYEAAQFSAYWNALMLGLVGASVAGYHGYRRNRKSVGWALGWGTLGFLFPVVTVGVSLVQGIGTPK